MAKSRSTESCGHETCLAEFRALKDSLVASKDYFRFGEAHFLDPWLSIISRLPNNREMLHVSSCVARLRVLSQPPKMLSTTRQPIRATRSTSQIQVDRFPPKLHLGQPRPQGVFPSLEGNMAVWGRDCILMLKKENRQYPLNGASKFSFPVLSVN